MHAWSFLALTFLTACLTGLICREMILAVAPEGPVMVTWANFHYLDFVLNWVAHVDALGIKPLVGAMDDKILQVSNPQLMPPLPPR